ncbi:MAG: hypothetical protein JRN52_01615 [Nitrososphaerota archaeon]|nr:hypothetical protein [Nitrososphaerota archaeon]
MDYTKFRVEVTGEPSFARFFSSLTSDSEVRKKLDKMLERLKVHPDAGDQIQRNLWPEDYKKAGFRNVFRYAVDDSKRVTYTIRMPGKFKLEVAIIEFFETHKKYERRFHY